MTEKEKEFAKWVLEHSNAKQVNMRDGYINCTFTEKPNYVPLAEDADFQDVEKDDNTTEEQTKPEQQTDETQNQLQDQVDEGDSTEGLGTDQREGVTEKDSGSGGVYKKAGRHPEPLFLELFGREDKDTTAQEKDRVKKYLRDSGYADTKWTASKDNIIMKIVCCFIKIWQEKQLYKLNVSPSGICNFFIRECGVVLDIKEETIRNKLKGMIEQECDQILYAEIKESFNR